MRTLLAGQGITISAERATALLREAGVLGLYEGGILVGAFVLHRDPDMRHWGADGRDPGLLVSLDPVTTKSSQVGRMLTLWLADYAANSRLIWVWCDVPCKPGAVDEPAQWFLKYLCDLGWVNRPGGGDPGDRAVAVVRDVPDGLANGLQAQGLVGGGAELLVPCLVHGRGEHLGCALAVLEVLAGDGHQDPRQRQPLRLRRTGV